MRIGKVKAEKLEDYSLKLDAEVDQALEESAVLYEQIKDLRLLLEREEREPTEQEREKLISLELLQTVRAFDFRKRLIFGQSELAKLDEETTLLHKKFPFRTLKLNSLSIKFSRSLNSVGATSIFLTALLVPLSLIVSPIWLPEQNFQIKGGSEYSGYLLNISGDEASILQGSSEIVSDVNANRIISQVSCQATGIGMNSWGYYLLVSKPSYIRCYSK